MDPSLQSGFKNALFAALEKEKETKALSAAPPPPPKNPQRKNPKITVKYPGKSDAGGSGSKSKPSKSSQAGEKRKQPESKSPQHSKVQAVDSPQKVVDLEVGPSIPGANEVFIDLDDPVMLERVANASKFLISEKDEEMWKKAGRKERWTRLRADMCRSLIEAELLFKCTEETDQARVARARLEQIKSLKQELQGAKDLLKKSKDEAFTLRRQNEDLTKDLEGQKKLLEDKRTVAMQWLATADGQARDLQLGQESYKQGARITELSYQLAWEDLAPEEATFEALQALSSGKMRDAFQLYEEEIKGEGMEVDAAGEDEGDKVDNSVNQV